MKNFIYINNKNCINEKKKKKKKKKEKKKKHKTLV